MLITKGKVSPSEPWRILEVAIGQQPDVFALRLSKEFKKLREARMQALIPMRRNSDGDAEWIIEHVYIRGANGSLGHIARLPGIDFLRPEQASDDWIANLLKHESKESSRKTWRLGGFVRVLTGPCARMCGHVLRDGAKKATVAIQLKTKRVLVHTFPENLQAIHCKKEHQVFYYQESLFT